MDSSICVCVCVCVCVCGEYDNFALWMFFALLEVCHFISVHVFCVVSDFDDQFLYMHGLQKTR